MSWTGIREESLDDVILDSDPFTAAEHIELSENYSPHLYNPLDVVLNRAQGVWVWDVEGRQYLDMVGGYGALNFGHCHPDLVAVAVHQMQTLTLSSRAFYHDQYGLFCRDLASLCGMDMVLPMNTGVEAVETALKLARRFGYLVKGIPEGQAEILGVRRGFHGRTIAALSLSDHPVRRRLFGPFTPGMRLVTFGDVPALESAISDHTAAVILEPILGESGVILPPAGYLKAVRELCSARNVVLIADEIQVGLCRTGRIFACEHEGLSPDLLLLGKSLGAGLVPLSAVIGNADLMELFDVGSHGSTFGGNPLACAVGHAVVNLIRKEHFERQAESLGEYFLSRLHALASKHVVDIRGRGLLVGIDIAPCAGSAYSIALKLKERGVLCKDCCGQTLRFAPALVITKEQIDLAIQALQDVLG